MALQLTYECRNGITLTDAYHRVIDINYNTVSNRMSVSIGIFPNAAAATAGKQPVDTLAFEYMEFDRTSNVNTGTQVYTYLKTLDLYATAVDV